MPEHANAFTVELIITARDPDATAEQLRFAIMRLLEKAQKFPPNYRFNWHISPLDIEVKPLEVVRTP